MAYSADRAFELISSAHERGRLAHAFLISGAHGCGKEHLAARVIQLVSGAKEAAGFDLFGEPVVVETPPLDELESGWVRVVRPRMKSRRIGVEEIRNLEQTLHLAAPGGACKVGVITEADRMNDQAANAFLKTLEEPPKNTLLLLLTANPQRLLPTILSRCVRLPLLGGTPLLSEGGAELVSALNHAASRGFGTPVAALHLKATFAAFLARSREAAEDAAKAAAKEETAAYRDATDGTWLKGREDFHKAAAEAEYLDARNRLFEVLLCVDGRSPPDEGEIRRARFSGFRARVDEPSRRPSRKRSCSSACSRSNRCAGRSKPTPSSRWPSRSAFSRRSVDRFQYSPVAGTGVLMRCGDGFQPLVEAVEHAQDAGGPLAVRP